MSALASALEDYLALRRSLGFKLDRAGRLLAQFVAYCDAADAEAVSIELAVAWATLPGGTDPAWAAQRLTVVRGFAKYLALWTSAPRSRLSGCSPTGATGRRPISTPSTRCLVS
jgi:hypothetical protein